MIKYAFASDFQHFELSGVFGNFDFRELSEDNLGIVCPRGFPGVPLGLARGAKIVALLKDSSNLSFRGFGAPGVPRVFEKCLSDIPKKTCDESSMIVYVFDFILKCSVEFRSASRR